jgi:hypothetical protein
MKKQLPSRPNLEQLKKQAKSLLRGQRAAVPAILARIREHHPRRQDASAIITSLASQAGQLRGNTCVRAGRSSIIY